jgi:NTP pyrophosphatase (non-canonical NTP hydrolase)
VELSEYQERAKDTAVYHNVGENMTYPAFALAGEVGEIHQLYSKLARDDDAHIDFRARMAQEIGDVLWNLAMLCHELELDLDHVALLNLAKLQDRKKRGVLQGSGDNR